MIDSQSRLEELIKTFSQYITNKDEGFGKTLKRIQQFSNKQTDYISDIIYHPEKVSSCKEEFEEYCSETGSATHRGCAYASG